MTAEIVSVGTELLLGQTVDTNAAELGRKLAALGIVHRRRQTVGDNLERAADAIREALGRADTVFTIGGLGPTQDDLTRDAVALALGVSLVHDPEIEAHLRAMFERRRIPWTDSQTRQAQRPEGSQPVANPNGTAPGLICERDGKRVIALPGPPNEFGPMVEGPVGEYLAALTGGMALHSRVVRVCGMGESMVERTIRDLVDGENPTVAPYAKLGEVHLRVSTMAPDADSAASVLQPVVATIRERLGKHVYGFDDQPLESAVIGLLRVRKQTLAVAESMTGGGLGGRLTSVEGSSAAFVGGVIAYQAQVKEQLLGVSRELLAAHGTVSEACAVAMAEGARVRFETDFALGITGNAGPTVDAAGTRVGTVFIALASSEGTQVVEHEFTGQRGAVRSKAAQGALTMLWFALNR